MLATDRVKADIHAHRAVQHELHARLFQLLDPLHDHGLFQLEPRDPIGQQAPRAVIAVINRDLHALPAQHVRRRQPPGPRADDPHRFRPLCLRLDRLHPAVFPCGVGDVFLHRPDGHRAMSRLLDHAIAFAEAILRADPPADFREGVGRLRNLIGFLQPPLGRQAQPVGDVVVQRAVRLAIGHAALAATPRLLGRLFGGIFAVDFVEILRPQVRRPLLGRLLGNGHELKHAVLCHEAPFHPGCLGCAFLLCPLRE